MQHSREKRNHNSVDYSKSKARIRKQRALMVNSEAWIRTMRPSPRSWMWSYWHCTGTVNRCVAVPVPPQRVFSEHKYFERKWMQTSENKHVPANAYKWEQACTGETKASEGGNECERVKMNAEYAGTRSVGTFHTRRWGLVLPKSGSAKKENPGTNHCERIQNGPVRTLEPLILISKNYKKKILDYITSWSRICEHRAVPGWKQSQLQNRFEPSNFSTWWNYAYNMSGRWEWVCRQGVITFEPR